MGVTMVGRSATLDTATLAAALPTAHAVVLCVDKIHGEHVLGANELALLRDGAVVVNPVFPGAVDPNALGSELESGRLMALYDAPEPSFSDGHPNYVASNSQAAYNTREAVMRTSDWAVESLLNMLDLGWDKRIVNPKFLSMPPTLGA